MIEIPKERFEPGYFPDKSSMNPEQKKFYSQLKSNLKKGIYINIDGQIAYLFIYLYEILERYGKKNINALSENLLGLSEIYSHEPKVARYCEMWGLDCLLAEKKYGEYLVKTEPCTIVRHTPALASLRINLQEMLCLDINKSDFLMLFKPRYSKYIRNNEAAFKDNIILLLDDYADSQGKSLIQILKDNLKSNETHEHGLFIGCNRYFSPNSNLMLKMYSSNNIPPDLVSNFGREAENLTRKLLGEPLIGEGWISETTLFNKLHQRFSGTLVMQHGRPFWLGRQHYDIWFPRWNIAVEYHGVQHFEPVEFFGGQEAYLKNLERDKRKQKLSEDNGVLQIVIQEGYDFDRLVEIIVNHRSKVIINELV